MILLSNFMMSFPIRTFILFQQFILAKFNTFSRSWKLISQFITLNITWGTFAYPKQHIQG